MYVDIDEEIKNEEYKKGFVDGYKKAVSDTINKIRDHLTQSPQEKLNG